MGRRFVPSTEVVRWLLPRNECMARALREGLDAVRRELRAVVGEDLDDDANPVGRPTGSASEHTDRVREALDRLGPGASTKDVIGYLERRCGYAVAADCGGLVLRKPEGGMVRDTAIEKAIGRLRGGRATRPRPSS